MEAPRGAREPTGTNGPTPHQPPQPRHPPPKRRTPPQKGEGQGPPAPHTEQGPTRGGRATRHPPPPPGPQTRAKQRQQGGARRSRNHYTNHDQPTPHPTRHTAGQDTPPHDGPTRGATQSCGGHSTGETPSNIPNLEAKPGRANGTAPQGVRESRKPPQHTTRRGAPHTSARPPHTHPHTHARATTQQREHTARTRTQARPRGHTPTRATSADPTPTTPTRERAPAHTSPTHAQRRAPGRPIAPALLPA